MAGTNQIPDAIYEFACLLLETFTQETIRITMHSDDSRLPPGYFELLYRKAREGVRIERIGFGCAEFFSQTADVHIEHKNYDFRFACDGEYRRMLMLDGKRLLRKTNEGVLYTERPEAIARYADYFRAQWTNARRIER